jgi:hypothetical protein
VPVVTLEQFSPRLNETFDILVGDAREPVTLVEATLLPQYDYRGKERDSFSLVFHSSSQTVVPQAMYTIENASMGRTELFLVPIGRDPEGISYQAIFN